MKSHQDVGPGNWQAYLGPSVIGLLALALFFPTLHWLFERWTMSVWQNAHGLLLSLVVIYLVRKELIAHRDLPISSSPWGFAILIPALGLHMIDAGMHSQLLSALAFIFALPGLALLFLGPARTRAILFPLSFMLFTLPIPLTFTEGIHMVLRQIATFGTGIIVPALNIPIYIEGTTLHTARGELIVADACSGFSTLYASIAIALLIAYRCQSTKRRILVLLIAAPLAIAANVIRVSLLVALVAWQGIEILGTSWHTISGLFTFALVLPVLFWIGNDSGNKTIEPVKASQ